MMRRAIWWVVLIPAVAAGQEKVTWVDHVAPVLDEYCTYCHGVSDPDGGLDLSSYAAAMAGGASGEVVIPGDPGGSRLLRLVTRQEEPVMPADGDALEPAAIKTLQRWIAGGALETRDSQPIVRKPATPSLSLEAPSQVEPGVVPTLPLAPKHHSERPPAVTALAASPTAPVLAVAGHTQVWLYHTDTEALLGVLPFPAGRVQALRFSRDGARLVATGGAGAERGEALVWDLQTGLPGFKVETRFDAWLAVDLRDDAGQLALGGPSRRVELHDTHSGAVQRIEKHTDWVTHLAYSPDGVLLASGDRAGNLHVWESRGAAEYLQLEAHPGGVQGLAWRPDSEVLASGAGDGKLRLFRTRDGKRLKDWQAHAGGVLAVTFAPDGRLISAGRDGAVRVWQADGKAVHAWAKLPETPLAVAVDPAGARVFAGDWAGQVTRWGAADDPGRRWPARGQPLDATLDRLHGELTAAAAAVAARRGETAAAVAAASSAATTARARREAADAAWQRVAAVPPAVTAGEALVASLSSAVAAAAQLPDSKRHATLAAELEAARVELDAARAAADEARRRLRAEAEGCARAAELAERLAAEAGAASERARQAEATATAAHATAEAAQQRWADERALAATHQATLSALASRQTARRERATTAETAAIASQGLALARRTLSQAESQAAGAARELEASRGLSQHLEQLAADLQAAEASVAAVVSSRERAVAEAAADGQAAANAALEQARAEQVQVQGLRVASQTALATCRAELTRLEARVTALRAALPAQREALTRAERVATDAEAAARAAAAAEQAAEATWLERCDALERARQQAAALRP